MLRRGFDVSVEEPRYADKLRTLLRTVIENGKGIEVNTSGLRHPALHETIPAPGILRLYRSLGGERVTVGSDAHRTVDAGKGVRQSFDLLRERGFRYVCAYRKREPEFITL
jgi:histidinol-phosphatase (PHP family)